MFELKREIVERAQALGFDLVGVTTPESPPHLEVYERWLERGDHGEMAYMVGERARAARRDPSLLMPGCRSILVLAARYDPPSQPEDLPERSARVAAYAVGDDYHEILVDRLQELARFIETAAGQPVSTRAYTDTGPILERELAQRAGLGWIGKNSMLINPSLGSYTFLAELLLSIELPPDEPFRTDHCGSCTRCLEACPTHCIRPDRTLDARRCISYLTIELRGSIPEAQRADLGEWLFGCDVCQQVCPWNIRFAEESQDPAFGARPFLQDPDLGKFLELNERAYQAQLRGSPLKRARLQGLKRNAAVVAGNRKAEGLLPVLTKLAGEDDPVVREHARWALERMDDCNHKER